MELVPQSMAATRVTRNILAPVTDAACRTVRPRQRPGGSAEAAVSVPGVADHLERLVAERLHAGPRGEGVPANRVQAFIVLKMAAINGAEDAMDSADQLAQQMSREELQAANQVLSQIFRNYLQDIQGLGSTPDFAPKP